MTERTLQDITKSYLEDLYSATFLGKCAGKVTQLPLLHKNKVKNLDIQRESFHLLQWVVRAIVAEGIHEKNSSDTLTQKEFNEIHAIINEFDFWSRVEDTHQKGRFQLPTLDNIANALEPYYDGIQRLFYYLKSDDGKQVLEQIKPYIFKSNLEISSWTFAGEGNKFPEHYDFELNFEKELLMNGNVDLEIANKNGFWINGPPIGIYGNPGFGKTIYLRQLAHSIADQALEQGPQQYTEIPFFFKAKVLAKHLREFGTRNYEDFSDESGAPITYNGLGANNFNEFHSILTHSALFTEPDLDANSVHDLLMRWREISNFPQMVLIIDAMDECGSRDDRYSIAKFLWTFSEFTGIFPKVIFSCRHSHKEEINDITIAVGSEFPLEFDMKFTQEELQNIMPTKLANAWGISSDKISYMASKHYHSFQHAANNPLFVGLFCLLIYNKQLDQVKVGEKSIKLPIKGNYSFEHVEFLKKIIEIGLEINIKDRVSNFDLQAIRKDFLYVSAVSELMNSTNFEEIFELCDAIFLHKIPAQNQKILKENLGVIYANDGENVEFTHKTIKEVALGLLMIEDNNFHEKIRTDLRHIMKEKWSTCQLLTLADVSGISKPTKNKLMKKIISLIDIYPSARKFLVYNMMFIGPGIVDELHYDSDILFVKTTKSNKSWEYHLIKKFEDAANSDSPFSMPQSVFRINKNTISAHQTWRVERINDQPNIRVIPLITNNKKLSIIDLENIEQVVGIWEVTQLTLSIIEDWEVYIQLFPLEIIIESYGKFISASKLPSDFDFRFRIDFVLNKVIHFNNENILLIYAKYLYELLIVPHMNQSVIGDIKRQEVVDSYFSFTTEQERRTNAREATYRSNFLNLEKMTYSHEAKSVLFLLFLDRSIYQSSCRILLENYLENHKSLEPLIAERNGIVKLRKLGAPDWMIKFELSTNSFSTRKVSKYLDAALRNTRTRLKKE